MQSSMRDCLIVGLDVPNVSAAEAVVDKLGDIITFYKIGYQLFSASGLSFAKELVSSGKKVFLDMKLLDIDNTVARSIDSILCTGVSMVTVHAYPKTMRAAVKAAQGTDLCLLGITVLTSMDQNDLKEAGYCDTVENLVRKRARQICEVGMGGIVASAAEASALRSVIGTNMALVTPGIRPRGSEHGDQKRVMSPGDAIKAGASHLVIARPIIHARNPADAALGILHEMEVNSAMSVVQENMQDH
ncbi:MAG: orotidine-5'-phosphate decarboxylase [Candidatus Tokpelaia sp. JSC085]|nr:MAG: orotidine-5'-phosphate decarboxylase [Candidatus Tokpelaia sp. JSC085]